MTNPNNVVPSNNPQTQSGLIYSSDYHIRTLSILTSDGVVVDIRSAMVEINLYEDIFAPCMSGSLLIGDAMDLMTNFKFHGNEYLLMTIDKPSLNNPINKVFRIYKISDREFKSSALQNYTIHFCSEEMILSTQQYISKSYRGMTISDMIKDVLNNKLGTNSKRVGTIDTTQGVFNVIVPRLQPLEAIEWLSSRAYSANASLFLFYENRDGYNFRAYESLIAQPVYQSYYKRPKTDTAAANNINSLNYLKIPQDFDLIESGRYGAYSSTLITFDMINHTMKNTNLQYGQFPLLNSSIPVNDSINRFGNALINNPDYFIKFYPVTTSDPTVNHSHPENWLTKKSSRLAQLHSFKMVLTIPGDVLMKVGNIIEVEIPQAVPQTQKGQINTLRTSKYLVTAVHHIFMNDVMSTVVELLSDSVSGALNAAQNQSQGLKTAKQS